MHILRDLLERVSGGLAEAGFGDLLLGHTKSVVSLSSIKLQVSERYREPDLRNVVIAEILKSVNQLRKLSRRFLSYTVDKFRKHLRRHGSGQLKLRWDDVIEHHHSRADYLSVHGERRVCIGLLILIQRYDLFFGVRLCRRALRLAHQVEAKNRLGCRSVHHLPA